MSSRHAISCVINRWSLGNPIKCLRFRESGRNGNALSPSLPAVAPNPSHGTKSGSQLAASAFLQGFPRLLDGGVVGTLLTVEKVHRRGQQIRLPLGAGRLRLFENRGQEFVFVGVGARFLAHPTLGCLDVQLRCFGTILRQSEDLAARLVGIARLPYVVTALKNNAQDRLGMFPADRFQRVEAACNCNGTVTLNGPRYRHLGVDAERVAIPNFAGRPIPILQDGKPIPELLSKGTTADDCQVPPLGVF